MPTRRRVLSSALGLAGTAIGAGYGTGAFARLTAEREFALAIANEAGSQLPIEPQGVDSDAVQIVEEDDVEVLAVDGDGLPPSALVSYGRFDDLSNPNSMTEEVFAITNRNQLDRNVDITIGLEGIGNDDDPGGTLALGRVKKDETFADDPDVINTVSLDADATATIENVEPDEQVVAGLIVDTTDADTSTFEGTLEIDAVRSDRD